MFDFFDEWLLIGIIGAISCIFFYIKQKQTYWTKQGVKGPKPHFFFGYGGSSLSLVDFLIEAHAKFGKIYGTYLGTNPHLIVGEPELLRQIFVKDFHIFPQAFDCGYLGPIERDFLTALYGERWKRMRSTLSPTFSTGKIKKMFDLMKVCNQEGQKELVKLVSSKEPDFDPKYFWSRYNLDVITKCCFAISLDVYNNSEDEVLRHLKKLFTPNKLKILMLFIVPKWLTEMLKISTTADAECLNYLKQVIVPIIEERKKSNNKANDFLQLLIDAEVVSKEGEELIGEAKKLSTDEIISSAIIFLMAGYQTTSTLLAWACFRLATNPDIQEKLFQEVSQADIYDYEVLQNLPYLDAVISETLRIDPPVGLLQRISHSDYILPGKDIEIKKGNVISIPIIAIHHDPENYPEPDVFDPNRFLEGSPKPFTFLPFGAGPRTCIGNRFALISAKLSLSSLVRNYKLFPNAKTPSKVERVIGSGLNIPKTLTLGIKVRC